jgi:hypothetical protein
VQRPLPPHYERAILDYLGGAIAKFRHEGAFTDRRRHSEELQKCSPRERAIGGDAAVSLKFEYGVVKQWSKNPIDAARIKSELRQSHLEVGNVVTP